MEAGLFPGIGEQCDEVPGASGRFGYQMSNPIPADGNWYCRRLRCPNGHPFWYHRQGSVGSGPDRHIMDRMELLCFGGEHHVILYFDMYHPGASSKVPDGLTVGEPLGRGETRGFVPGFPQNLPEYDPVIAVRYGHPGSKTTN